MIRNTELTAALAHRFAHVSLNPQPLPPKAAHAKHGSHVALNPQPLPPKAGSPADKVSLNPQPLPPRSAISAFARAFPGLTSNAPASDRGIIVVGGRSVLPNALNQRGIIIVGG